MTMGTFKTSCACPSMHQHAQQWLLSSAVGIPNIVRQARPILSCPFRTSPSSAVLPTPFPLTSITLRHWKVTLFPLIADLVQSVVVIVDRLNLHRYAPTAADGGRYRIFQRTSGRFRMQILCPTAICPDANAGGAARLGRNRGWHFVS